ncbi:MAG: DUF4912 domain-containing protein [Spirochaetia bacterium]|nr:DUF4912 domain-containing protein [Spirochaetia bacterium]MCF7946456.1 DUF4912 domain-containing protein [Spirochaetia bacterium]
MSEKKLYSLPLEDLRCIVRRWGVKDADSLKRNDIIDLIEEIVEERKSDHRINNNEIMKLKGKKYDILEYFYSENESGELFEIPETYIETSVHLMLRDPFWAYAYWNLNPLDIDQISENHPSFELKLRVFEIDDENTPVNKVKTYFDIPIKAADKSWYINLSKLDTWYAAAVIAVDEGWCSRLCLSNRIFSPGGYWVHHIDELYNDKRALELFHAGSSDNSGHKVDSSVVSVILDELEKEWKGDRS